MRLPDRTFSCSRRPLRLCRFCVLGVMLFMIMLKNRPQNHRRAPGREEKTEDANESMRTLDGFLYY
jgi:hypothetical protein